VTEGARVDQARRATAATLLVGIAIAAGAYTLTEVVWSGSWLPLVLGVLAAVVAVVAVVRWLVLTVPRDAPGPALRALPTIAGAVVSLLLWVWLGTSTDPDAAAVGDGQVSRTFTELGRLHQLAAESVAPINATAPVVVATLGATLLLFLLGDLLVVVLRAPVAAAAPALVLWLPALVIEAHVPVLSVALTILALLCLLAVDRAGAAPPRTSGRFSSASASASDRPSSFLAGAGVLAGAAVITVIALVLGAAASALPGSSGKPLAHLFGSASGSARLGNDLNVLNDLGERPSTVVMKLSAPSGLSSVGPLRVFTLTRFDGKTWQPDNTLADASSVSPGDLLWPSATTVDGSDDPDGGTTAPQGKPTTTITVTPHLLPQYRLAVPTEPRTVTSPTPVRYDPVRDEVYRVVGSTDSSYQISVYDRGLTAKSLGAQRAAFTPDSPVSATVREQSLQVPTTSHIADVTALAKKITAPASDDYDKALLLQTYFRDANTFTYSTKAPRATTGDPVWDFLLARSGYCVQYATAMAVMLRTLGIPARVGVGYLTQSIAPNGTSDVTGQDAHAWPEVYFADSGWVRFEPTPAVQTGAAPSWADPYTGSSEDGSQSDALRPGATAAPEPLAQDTGAADPNANEQSSNVTHASSHASWSSTRVVVVLVLGALVLLAAAAWWRRRRLRHRPIADAEDAWEQLRRRLEALEISWPDSATPRQVPALVAAAVRSATGGSLSGATLDALGELSDAVQHARYARGAAESPVELANLVDDCVAGLQDVLRPKPARRP
jgi:transglutaminase-like putative cysteine protease